MNLSLTDIETEKFVGGYRCDIVCTDELTGKAVLIENQLEPTNHDHLGKIITYASGLDASVVVWIVASAREEHASAIEWLNKHTTTDVDFFLLEVHAYTIEDSQPAPMFKIIEQPNDFAKTVKSFANGNELTETKQKYMEFWNLLNETLDQKGRPFNKRKSTPDHWYSVAVGSSRCHISIDLVNKEHKIRIGLWIPNDKALYDRLYTHKDEIEADFGERLNWDRKNNNKASSFSIDLLGLDFKHQENYPELIEAVIEKTVSLREAVKPFLE